MSFNIGQTTGFPSAASTAPTFGVGGFGTSTTTATKGFGQPSIGFGSSQPSTSAFGQSQPTGAFGTTQQPGVFGAAQPTGAFGATQSAPTFGAGQSTSGFGAPQTSSAFGATTGGLFGNTAQTSAFGGQSTGVFGSGASTGFGASAPASTSFGFNAPGTATSTGSSLFGSAPASGSLFGGTQSTTTAAPSFQGFFNTQTSTGGGMFSGGLQSSTGTGFNFQGLGAKPNTSQQSAFGSFGNTPSLFGQSQPQQNQFSLGGPQPQQQTPQQQEESAVLMAVLKVNLFGDERDAAVARWNLLQAQSGAGKGYFAQGMPPVTFTQDNPFFRFKALGYSQLPDGKEEDGVVSLSFNKKEADVKTQQQQLVSSLSSALFSGRPQYFMTVQGVRASSENSCQMLITVSERTQTNQTRRIPASELANSFVNIRTQLVSLGVDNVVPIVGPSQEWVREYLSTPPPGIDQRLWQQAQLDSPDPARFIPVPMIGFAELRWRMKCQEAESSRHMAFLAQAEQQVCDLRRCVTETEVKLTQRRQALLGLQRRLLHLLVKLQVARRSGTALLPLEEDLRSRLEQIQAQLSRPSHCKARLGELLAQMRLQTISTETLQAGQHYTFDTESVQELQKFLSMEQEGISHLIDVASTDRDSVKVIHQGMLQIKGTSLDTTKHVLYS